jgi:DNA-binding NarL/FixJ family response regulator
MSLRILIVDDHDVVRQGVRLILRRHADWRICGEAENGVEALEKEKDLKPDLIILDISMPGKDGLEVAAELRARNSAAKVLVFTMHDSKELATAIQASGAKGYVVKTHAARDLANAIQTISEGGDFFTSGSVPAKQSKREKKFPLFCLDCRPAFA